MFIHRFDNVVYLMVLLNLGAAGSQSFRAGREVVMYQRALSPSFRLTPPCSVSTVQYLPKPVLLSYLGGGLLLKTREVTFR